MLDLNKYSGQDKSQIFHTSGHARIGQGDRIGSAGTQSFQQRLELNQKDRTIADYKRSAIGARVGSLGAKRSTPRISPLKKDAGRGSSRQAFNAGDQSTQPVKPSGFKEPPSRGYNPYG
jgi:hypothetical protein